MAKVIGVQFHQNGKVYYFNPGELEIRAGQYVIVDTERGVDLAEAMMDPFEYQPAADEPALKPVVRIATEADIQCATENRAKEKEAFGVCQRKIQEHKLEMKLVSVEYAFDGSKILFYFTANGRVDFRSLVKDLASVFKTRIELRQIGVRDEARMLGGLGPCGRPICCKAFLNDFQPVSIKMAKEQNLSLNPTKISGVCGRLMCCLKYEQEQYEQVRKKMPRVGREVITPDGNGTVTDLNIVKETVSVRITNGDSSEIRSYPMDSISRPGNEPRGAAARKAAAQAEEPEEEISQAEDEMETAGEEYPFPDEMEDGTATAETEGRTENAKPRERKPRGNRNEGGEQPAGERSGKPERKLGQPVRRENPRKVGAEGNEEGRKGRGRNQERTAESENGKTAGETAGKNTPKEAAPAAAKEAAPAAPKARPKNNWADQLQKAMEAAEHSN